MSTGDSQQLQAGAAVRDITPAAGVHLAGSGAGEYRPAQSVLDPLFAKAVVFASGGRRICLVTLDVTIVTGDYSARIRRGIAARTGIDPEAILVHALQTHSAPSLGHFMLDPDFPLDISTGNEYIRGAETAYCERAAEAAVEAAVQAVASLRPVRLGVGRGLVADLAFNRRAVRRDGTVMMPKPESRDRQPFGIPDLCYLEGPIDPEVGVLCAQDAQMRPVACLLHHTCHPVNVFGHRETYYAVSADWPGAWAAETQASWGGQGVAAVLNGCCGNINPWHPFDPDYTPDHRRMGRELAAMSQRILHSLRFTTEAELDWRVERIALPYREIPAARRQEVAEILAANPVPPRAANGEIETRWFLAASTRSVELCQQREPTFSYEIQVLRLGDVALVGLPGEPFVEGQLEIKTRSPAASTFVAHLTSHYVGYLPTRAAYARGGHEANAEVTYWAKLAPGSLETVVERTVALLKDVFASR